MRPTLLVLTLAAIARPAAAECPELPCGDGSHTCRVGLVNNDEVWDADDGPYLITGDLTIRPWATLTVRPGTEVRVATCDEQGAGADEGRVELVALGSLQVQGTEEAPVVFRSHGAGARGDWYGLIVQTEAGGGHAGASSIHGAEIRDAVHAITAQSALPTAVEANHLHGCSGIGLRWESFVSPNIAGNTIDDNGGVGIQIVNTSEDLYGATLRRNIVFGSGGSGINVEAGVSVTLQRNTVRSNGGSGIRLAEGTSGTVENNLVFDNASHGLDATRAENTSLAIAHNTVHRNRGDGVHVVGVLTPNTTVLRANIVSRNAAAGIRVPAGSEPVVAANDVWFNGTDYIGAQADAAALSANPVVVDDSGASAADWDLRITAWSPCIDRAPADDAPALDFHGEVRGFDGDFDGAPGSDIGATEYLLTAPEYAGEGILGHLNVDTIWGADDGPIVVSGDLFVPRHVTLMVQEGTELIFSAADGMRAGRDLARTELIVEGRLEAGGGTDHPVVLRCSGGDTGCWYGVRFVGEEGPSTLEDAEVRGALIGVSVEVTARTRPLLRAVDFLDFAVAGVRWTSPVAADVRFNTFAGDGIAVQVVEVGDELPSSPRIESNTIDGCTTAFDVRFTGVATVRSNTVTGCDGGVLLHALEAASAIVSQNEVGQHVHVEDHGAPAFHFTGPITVEADGNGAYGHQHGIVVGAEGAATLVNSLVYGNWGTGIHLQGAAPGRTSAVVHGTVVYNGVGVRLASVGEADLFTLANSIVVGNVRDGVRNEGAQQPTVSSNDVWDNGGQDYVNVAPDAASLSENPRFVDDSVRFADDREEVVQIDYNVRIGADSNRDRSDWHPDVVHADLTEMRFRLSLLHVEGGNYDHFYVYDCDNRQLDHQTGFNGVYESPWWTPGACKRFRLYFNVDGTHESHYTFDWYEYRHPVPPAWDTSAVNPRLQANSGLIESGDPAHQTGEDYLGEARPYFPFGENQDDARPDIGAIEYRENLPPVVRVGDDVRIVPGEEVTFDGSFSFDPDGNIVVWAWDFGDLHGSDQPVAVHVYPDEGEYDATLTLTDDDGATASDSLHVVVRELPPNVPPNAVAGLDRNGLVGIPLIFDGRDSTDDDGEIVRYAWNFGDGERAEGPVVSHFYAALGGYTVTLTVTDDRDGQDSDTAEVQIVPGAFNRPPEAVAGGDALAHQGDPVELDGSASDDTDGFIASWHWDLGDGQEAEGEFVVHTWADAGQYDVTLTVTDDDGATDTAAFTVTVNARPLADPGTNRVIDQGELLVLDGGDSIDPDGQVVAWRWDFGDGQRGEGAEVEHAWARVGQYQVTLTVEDELGGTGSAAIVVEVQASDNAAPIAEAGEDRGGLVGAAVAFDGSASEDPDGDIVSWRWDFGDGDGALGARAEHAYAQIGEYRVTLTVTDDGGAIGTDQVTVTVRADNVEPLADAGEDRMSEIGEEVAFDGGGSLDPDGRVVRWHWDFGDGEEAEGEQVAHAWAADGVFHVTLTVTDDTGAEAVDSAVVTVLVPNVPPTAAAGDALEGEVGSPVAFDGSGSTDPDGQLVTWRWFLGDGTVREGERIQYIYVQPGDYEVVLAVTDDDGGQDEDSTRVHVVPRNQGPQADAGNDVDVGVGEAVVFDASGSTDPDGQVVSWDWDFGDDGVGEGERVEHTYGEAGQYIVVLTVTDDDGAIDRDSVRVRVQAEEVPDNVPPVADAGPDREVAAGAPVAFDGGGSSDEDGRIVGWDWDLGDGEVDAGEAVIHAFAAAQVYVVRLTVTDDDGATDSDTAVVTVTGDEPPPDNQPPVADAGADVEEAPGEDVALDGGGSRDADGEVAAYAWDFGDGEVGEGAQVGHAWAEVGRYTVTLTVTDDDGATGTDTLAVVVTEDSVENRPPVASAGDDQQIAVGRPVRFDGSASADPDGELVSWAWDYGDGTSGTGQVSSHTYAQGGVFTVTLVVTDDDGATGRDTALLTVNLPPVAEIGGPELVVVGAEARYSGSPSSDPDGEVVAWAWDFGDGEVGEGESVGHVFSAAGTYAVALTVTDDMGATARAQLTVKAEAPPANEPDPDAGGDDRQPPPATGGRSDSAGCGQVGRDARTLRMLLPWLRR